MEGFDPMKRRGSRSGSVADVLASARASLNNPSRPFTPADGGRHLFDPRHSDYDADNGSRPQSVFSVSSLYGGTGSSAEQRKKQTRAIRHSLTKAEKAMKTQKQAKKLKHFPQRKYAVKA